MRGFKDQWVKYKISELHPNDLIQYATIYGIQLSYDEAADLLQLVKTNHWSINDKQSMNDLLQQAKDLVSPDVYQLLKKLFHEYID